MTADRVTNYTLLDIETRLPEVVSSLDNSDLDQLMAKVRLSADVQRQTRAAFAARLNIMAVLKTLLDLPSSVILSKHKESISKLVSVVTPNDDGVTALHLAVSVGRPDIVKALLRFDEMGKLMEKEFSEAAAAGASFQGPLLVECAALGGDTSLSLLFVQKTQDRRLRLLCAGFKSLAEYMNI